ncbi:MAG: SDR family NAD(P)-dependent oxidoreductase [Myxococcota bacterium]
MKELEDRVAVITGGASGIGEALVRACGEAGMHCVVADVEADAAERVAGAAREQGRRALAVQVDVSKPDSVEALAERCYDEFGACHLLCNNAGVLVMGPLQESSARDWDWLLDVNLRGITYGTEAFLPRMLAQQGECHIVNTASLSGLVALPGVGIYTTTKFAVVGFSEVLRLDLAGSGIGVSVLCPGGVTTRIMESRRNRPDAPDPSTISSQALRRAAAAGDAPENEMIEPDAVARAVLEGVRENAAYIITHPQHRGLVERRFQSLLAAYDRAAERTAG